MDGPTTFRQLRANFATSAIPVVFLTAKQQAADKQRFMEMGVTGVLAKPFDPMTLASALAEILGWNE